MLKKILPFVLVAIALSIVISVLVATQRMGCPPAALGRFMKRSTDLPIEPGDHTPVADPSTPEPAA